MHILQNVRITRVAERTSTVTSSPASAPPYAPTSAGPTPTAGPLTTIPSAPASQVGEVGQ